MLYLEDFRAKTSALLGKEQELTGNEVGYGQKWYGLLARYDQGTSTWKTAQCSLVEDLEKFSEIWPKWGSMRNGVVYLRETWEPITSGKESGSLLPTPTCHNSKECAAPSEYKRNQPSLASIVGGKIHPELTEWMMGWPIGWTDLKPLEMDKYQSWRQQHGIF